MRHALKKEKSNLPRFKKFQKKKVHQILVWKVIKPLKVNCAKWEWRTMTIHVLNQSISKCFRLINELNTSLCLFLRIL